jgi:hypothetical protein
MADSTFDLNAFLQESKDVLLNPKSYFSTMKISGGMTEPLIKAVIYGAISGAIAFIWSLLRIGAVTGGLFGGAIGVMIFIWTIIGAIIGLFIGGVILLVISSICKGNTDFEANVRVTAAVMVMMPVNSFFAFAGHFSIYLGVVVSLALSLYLLWLYYNGLTQALKSNPETTKIVTYVLIAIFVIFILVGLGARKRAMKFMNEFNSTDVKEMMKDLPKN